MLVSLVEMPAFVVREEEAVYEIADETARQWAAAGLCVPVIAGPETASVQPGGEQAVTAKASRKRG